MPNNVAMPTSPLLPTAKQEIVMFQVDTKLGTIRIVLEDTDANGTINKSSPATLNIYDESQNIIMPAGMSITGEQLYGYLKEYHYGRLSEETSLLLDGVIT